MSQPSAVQPALDEVLAVVVLYERDLAQSPTYLTLSAELRRLGATLDLLVYDNSTRPGPVPAHSAADGWRITYRHDGTNPGVSRAYLEGARQAASCSKRWLLLLDQDTAFPSGALEAYVDAVARHPAARLFAPILRVGGGAVSPCAYRFKQGRPLRAIRPGVLSLRGRSVLNSGLWIELEAYLAAGGHDARIHLDFADHEFIERFKAGGESLVVVDAECQHGLSAAHPTGPAAGLERFRYYCLGARHATRGVWDGLLTYGVVAGRALLLSVRHREPAFLRVAADALFQRHAR